MPVPSALGEAPPVDDLERLIVALHDLDDLRAELHDPVEVDDVPVDRPLRHPVGAATCTDVSAAGPSSRGIVAASSMISSRRLTRRTVLRCRWS